MDRRRFVNKMWAKLLKKALRRYNALKGTSLDIHGHDAYFSKVILYCPYGSIKSKDLSIFKVCRCYGCLNKIY